MPPPPTLAAAAVPHGPCGPGGESREGSVAGRRRRRGPGLPLAAWRGSDPRSPPFGAEALGLGLDPQHPSGPLSSPGPFRCHFDPGVSLPSPSPRPLPSTPSRAAGREGRVRRWAEARRTVWELALGGSGILRALARPGVPRSWPLGLSHCHLKAVLHLFF